VTRIWFLNPSIMCKNHLCGQWKELFQFVGSLNKGISIQGYLDKKAVSTNGLNEYALLIKSEMAKRGYKNKEWTTFKGETIGEIDLSYNLCDLYSRCARCRENIDLSTESIICNLIKTQNNLKNDYLNVSVQNNKK